MRPLPLRSSCFNRTLLSLCCAAAMTNIAHAQQIETPPVIEELLVTATPIKDSQAESILRQREATNVVNIIAADDIGRFPDNTAAAALARLPAVAVQRDQGQERYIQVRGAPARWTSVAFDGINVLGAEERIFRFDSVPAAIMDSVEISKTLTADMSAEAVAGRVNIKTYSPLSRDGWNLDLDAGLGTLELGDGDQQRYAGRLSWGGETFGAVVALSSVSAEQTTDNNEMSYNANGVPTLFDFRSYKLTRETNSAMVKLEFAPSEDHQYILSSLYTEFLDHEFRNMYQLRADRARSATHNSTNNPTGGELVGVPVRSYLQDGNYENSTFTNTLGGDHQLTEWKLNWRLNYTETESDMYLPIVLQDQTNPLEMHSFSYDRSNPNLPRVQLYTTISNGAGGYTRGEAVTQMNQTGFGAHNLVNYATNLKTESIVAKTDAEHEWQMGRTDATLSIGVQLDQRDASSPGSSSAYVPIGQLAQANGLTLSPNDFVTDALWQTDFDRGFNAFYMDNAGFRRQLDGVMSSLISANQINPGSFYPAETRYDITEDVFSAYAMNRWQWDEQEIVVGVRVEKTELDSHGFFKDNNGTTAINLSNSDTAFFPSIHWNMDLSDEMKIRLAAVTGTSRPNFNDLRSGANANDTSQTVGGGNPYLNPEMARGIDGSWEWYFTDAALASIGIFYRQVDDVLYDATTKVGDDRFNSAEFDRSNYDYTTVLNGDDGEISGIEFAYMHQWEFLPEALQGFGMQANLALLDSEFTTPDGRTSAFTGTSDKVINASVFYENFGWSVQLNWQWRDAWLDDISGDAASDYYWKDTERLDLSVRYQLNDTIGFYLDANNLSDELGVRYQGSEALPVEVEGFGRRYLLGVRASF